jgi:hypothetical protein
MTWQVKSSKNVCVSVNTRLTVVRIKGALDSPPLGGLYYSKLEIFNHDAFIGGFGVIMDFGGKSRPERLSKRKIRFYERIKHR